MTARNDITGDAIQTRINSDSFRDNFDRIFRKTESAPEKKTHECVACGCQLDDVSVVYCERCATK